MRIEVTPRATESSALGYHRRFTTFDLTDEDGQELLSARMPLVRHMDHTTVELLRSATPANFDEIVMHLGGLDRTGPGDQTEDYSGNPHITYIAHSRRVPDGNGHPNTVIGYQHIRSERQVAANRTADDPSATIRPLDEYVIRHSLAPEHKAVMLAAADATCRELEREKYREGVDTPFSKELKNMGIELVTHNPEQRRDDPWPNRRDKLATGFKPSAGGPPGVTV